MENLIRLTLQTHIINNAVQKKENQKRIHLKYYLHLRVDFIERFPFLSKESKDKNIDIRRAKLVTTHPN